MTLKRALAAVLLPPLAVTDCGCGALVITCVATLAGWVPGIAFALFFGAVSAPKH